MPCSLCTQKLTYSCIDKLHKACESCQRHVKQMLAGFHGVTPESRPSKITWDNTEGYLEWVEQLNEIDTGTVQLKKSDDYIIQRCDIRDMKRIVGLPKFLPLEKQVYTAWILDGIKDEKIQEVLGLTYSQLFHVKKIVKIRLQRNMAYYHQIKKLEKEHHG